MTKIILNIGPVLLRWDKGRAPSALQSTLGIPDNKATMLELFAGEAMPRKDDCQDRKKS